MQKGWCKMKTPYTTFALETISKLIGDELENIVARSRATNQLSHEDTRLIRVLAEDVRPLATLLREIDYTLKAECDCKKKDGGATERYEG